MKNKNTLYLTQSALIAALYVVLTLLINSVGLASGAIQIRISEALTILPIFTSAAVPGLFIGCLLSNILTDGMPLDVIFGALATLFGALGTRFLRKRKWLAPLPPIIANTLIVPFILQYVYKLEDALWFLFLTVGIGEIISAGVLGMLLYFALNKYKSIIFK